jgi:microcystin-dependent protein
VTLLDNEMATHTHSPMVTTANGTVTDRGQQPARPGPSTGNLPGEHPGPVLQPVSAPATQLPAQTIGPTGGSQPHNNIMPTLFLNYCIALQGAFPARN